MLRSTSGNDLQPVPTGQRDLAFSSTTVPLIDEVICCALAARGRRNGHMIIEKKIVDGLLTASRALVELFRVAMGVSPCTGRLTSRDPS